MYETADGVGLGRAAVAGQRCIAEAACTVVVAVLKAPQGVVELA
jgi:hypothetical protein